MPRLRKILVPIDGSVASLAAHRLALDLAATYGAETILVYVVDSSVLAELSRLSGQERPRLVHDMEESGRRLLSTLSRESQKKGVMAAVDLLHGMPDEIIMQEASRQQVDLIVMGKIGRKGHRRSLLGSVTERVLEASEVPVLVVSPTEPVSPPSP
jgi:nucleotide-binding universal stress UspA family protein